ncbi:MAG TPA: hypothetical protein PKC30_03000 [Saprospiraceae bacterium]|nr:hypothetical protein [Saprospiraceae bacterium]
MFIYKIGIYTLYILYFVIFFRNTPLSSQVKFVNEFLNIGVGARAHGMFGSVVATVSNGTAGYWNPAGLANLANPLQINAMHANWFGGVANYDFISISTRLNDSAKSAGSFTLIRMGVDNIPNTLNLIGPDGSLDYNRVFEFSAADYAGIFSYGRNLSSNEKIRVGGSAKIIHRSIGSFGSAWGFGIDLGMQMDLGKFKLGIAGRDITTTFNAWSFNLTEEERQVFINTGNDIPVSTTEIALPRIIAGIAWTGGKESLSYTVESNLNISTNGTRAGVFSTRRLSIDPTIGGEVGIHNLVFVRVGFGNIQRIINDVNADATVLEIQPNMGMGLLLGRLKVDYALTNIGNLSGVLISHIFSVSIDFNKRD